MHIPLPRLLHLLLPSLVLLSPTRVLASASGVLDLTPDNFEGSLLSGTPGLVEFFAPWCGHCKKLAPTYEELGDSFASSKKVVIGKVDGDEHKSLSTKYGISGFPTIKWFDGSDGYPEDYTGGRDLESLQAFITERTGVKPRKRASAPSDVTMLTDSSFEKAVGGDKGVFVAFTAPWCGHCKTLAPIWEQLATDFSPEPSVLIAKVDAEANKGVAEQHGVKSYPTIKFFPKGSATPIDYSGGRDEAAFVSYVNEQAGTHRAVGGGLDLVAGTVAALDAIVATVAGSGKWEGVAAEVAAAAAGLKDTYASYYVKVLGKLAENKGYVEKELGRLEGMLKKGGLARSKEDDFTSRINVLKKFVMSGGRDEL